MKEPASASFNRDHAKRRATKTIATWAIGTFFIGLLVFNLIWCYVYYDEAFRDPAATSTQIMSRTWDRLMGMD